MTCHESSIDIIIYHCSSRNTRNFWLFSSASSSSISGRAAWLEAAIDFPPGGSQAALGSQGNSWELQIHCWENLQKTIDFPIKYGVFL